MRELLLWYHITFLIQEQTVIEQQSTELPRDAWLRGEYVLHLDV